MRHYCTLFNMDYAAKGLALYQGLLRHSSGPWCLWVLPMDQETYAFLKAVGPKFPAMQILSPADVITGRLAEAVKGRSVAYTCFTTTGWLMGWLMERLNFIHEITYLDADLGFYSDPEKAHKQITLDKSVAIVPHRFLPHDVDRLAPSGQYNVSWVTIRDDEPGRAILKRWTDECLAKCDAASCGDQKYLDAWPGILGRRLHIFADHGVGVAPWNAARYEFTHDHFMYADRGLVSKMVFYHFHELKRRSPHCYHLTGYKLPDSCVKFVYEPYLKQLEANESLIKETIAC